MAAIWFGVGVSTGLLAWNIGQTVQARAVNPTSPAPGNYGKEESARG
jgi:hypothetical protein